MRCENTLQMMRQTTIENVGRNGKTKSTSKEPKLDYRASCNRYDEKRSQSMYNWLGDQSLALENTYRGLYPRQYRVLREPGYPSSTRALRRQ